MVGALLGRSHKAVWLCTGVLTAFCGCMTNTAVQSAFLFLTNFKTNVVYIDFALEICYRFSG